MTLAVDGTLTTHKNTQKNTQTLHDVLQDNNGNGFWFEFIEIEAPERVPWVRQKKNILVVSYDTKSTKLRQKPNSSKKFPQS